MKIAVICDVLGEPNNGTTIAAYNLINYLKSKGHEIKVVSPDKSTEGKEGYYVVPSLNLLIFNGVVKANGVELAKADKKILTEVIENVDVVHILMPFHLGKGAIKIARKLNKPITASFHVQAENFTSHIFCMNARLINHLTYLNFYKKVYRYCDVVHYPTEFIKDLFESHIKTQLPSVVISNGVNDVFFNDTAEKRLSDKFTIFCMGRYSKEKAQQTLIKAVGKSDIKDKVKLVFAGSGPKKKKLMRKARRYGLDCTFEFYSRENLVKVLHGADLYVHTALMEIEAISCTEAIVSGLVPVICDSERSATKNFAVDEKCLYRKNDYKDLINKIKSFYDNPEIIKEYKKKYESERLLFNQESCMKKMEEMFYTAIENHSAKPNNK